MKKTEAEELSARLHHEAIDHELRINHHGPEANSVRAFFIPYVRFAWGDEETRDYACKVFEMMTKEGDWEIEGSDGRAYVTRY